MSDYTEFDPRDNVLLGSSHLSWLSGRLEELHHVLAAYNAGSGNLSKWVNKMGETSRIEFMESIPFEETSEYVKKVIANYEVYKKLYAE
jgi:soluble lytic murein transglycosylase